MNRQLRRITEREERRTRERGRPQARQKERTSVRQFLREVRQELKRVSWPTRQELWTFTAVTLITTTALTVIIFAMDFAFKAGVLSLIRELQQ